MKKLFVSLACVTLMGLTASGAVVVIHDQEQSNCQRTPIHYPENAVGFPLAIVIQQIASEYATYPRNVRTSWDGPDALELAVFDGAGDFSLGGVRVERDGLRFGWLRMTRNTCDD